MNQSGRSAMSAGQLRVARIEPGPNGKQYCCVECPVKYDDKEKLELHVCSHTKEYRFICGICGTGLKRKEHLDRHTMEHLQVRPHLCEVCNKGFKRKEHLNIHRTIHGDKCQKCSFCNKSFYRKDHLQKHLQTHSKEFLANFYSAEDQESMEMETEMIDVKPVICNVAVELGSENKDSTADAVVPLSGTADRPFACPTCGKSYKRKDHLKIHSWTHLEKDKICTVCGRAFHKSVQLLLHMNEHKEDERITSDIYTNLEADNTLMTIANQMSRPHECNVCHKRFKRKQHLKVHSSTHQKPAAIWCDTCSVGFATNEQFNIHDCMPSQENLVDDDNYKYIGYNDMSHNGNEMSNPYDSNEGYDNDSNSYSDANDGVIGNDNGTVHSDNGIMHNDNDSNSFSYSEVGQDENYESENENVEQKVRIKTEPRTKVEFLNIPIVPAESDIMRLSELNIPVPLKVFVCKFCSKAFKRKDHYKIHLHVHTGVKSFFCPDCGRGFYRKDHLQKHSQIHEKRISLVKKKEMPDLMPIRNVIKAAPAKKELKPAITIHAPSNSKILPFKIKVPYEVVVTENGEQRSVMVEPDMNF